MKNINEMNFELWYKKGQKGERKIAAFHFRHHAEDFLETFPFPNKEDFEIVSLLAE